MSFAGEGAGVELQVVFLTTFFLFPPPTLSKGGRRSFSSGKSVISQIVPEIILVKRMKLVKHLPQVKPPPTLTHWRDRLSKGGQIWPTKNYELKIKNSKNRSPVLRAARFCGIVRNGFCRSKSLVVETDRRDAHFNEFQVHRFRPISR